jgi:predicted ATPase/DNA-binding SARP family transcriptional activator
MPIEFRILGPLEVSVDAQALPLGSPKQRALLGLLLVYANETLSRDRLIEELWAEAAPATVASALHVYLSRLRRLLESATSEDLLVREAYGYRLMVEQEQLDANRFQHLVGQGSAELAAGKADAAAARLRQALALWRGPPLADLQMERFAIAAAARLDAQRVFALEQRLEADLACGRHSELIGELEALTSEHPYREGLRAQLMLALYRSGRQADALRIYRQTRDTLVKELGIEPTAELQRLERSILAQDPALETPGGVSQTERHPREAVPATTKELSELPTGTVTFLFADVEGSTRFLNEVGPERYAEALAEYRHVVGDACARNSGVQVDVQGDGVFVAFPTASAAVVAARELSGAFSSGRMKVRVGIHTGTPLVTEDGYVGLDVHRAARIARAAHGGQVLISESTAALVDDELQPLGEHRLPDLLEPLRLFQLGEGDFPAPTSLGTSNLPEQPTLFAGRERELAEVLALLRDSQVRLLTLTGAGGSGKTRLALQAAADAGTDYPDGVFWVPLQALRAPELVEPTIAQVVGARDDLADHLAPKRALLLLDNFEQVIRAARNLGELCARLPNLKILVTSREPLHLSAEREYPVPPLREREAISFFLERARAVRPDFEEDEAVLEICRRLDCLPLALELAAARVKALSTRDLLQRLDRRLPLLTGGPRDAPERQRTLRATIGWSYELLTSNARRLFASLAVFAGGCTLEAAEEVCRAEVDAIAELVDKSLLRREGERYFMLETIGEYALERLVAGGELAEFRQRHAEYYLELARSIEDMIRSPQAAALLDRLERDHDNLRAALAWLSGATPDRALRLAVWGLAGRLHSFADVALDHRNTIEAARLYRESLEIGRQLKDDLQTAYSLAGIAAVSATRGRRDHAARLWGSVVSFEEASGTRLHETERARYGRVLGEFERALDTSGDFIEGKSMTLDEAVEYALANTD